jgi:hypothetical protein
LIGIVEHRNHQALLQYCGTMVVEVPASGGPALFVFAASVVLQRLAFRMSVKKMEYLDRLRVVEHGVHPDAPKNVSKSITVD